MDTIQGMTKEARVARRERWAAVIAEQQTGELGAAAFCRERRIAAWQFSYWRKALAPVAGDSTASGFIEMRAPSGASGVWVEAGQWRVHVDTAFDSAVLKRTLAALGGT